MLKSLAICVLMAGDHEEIYFQSNMYRGGVYKTVVCINDIANDVAIECDF